MDRLLRNFAAFMLAASVAYPAQFVGSTTETPTSGLQVTPPSEIIASLLSRPVQNATVTPAHVHHTLRTVQAKRTSTEASGYSKVAYAGAIRNGPYLGSPYVRKEAEFREESQTREVREPSNRILTTSPAGNELPEEQEIIRTSKQPFPPAPGAGYVPPATVIDQPAPIVLGFQHDRDSPRVEYVTADCFNNYMKIVVQFNGSFSGLIYSSGYAHDTDCVYVNGSGADRYEFSIRLNRCGTLGRPEFELSANEVPDRNHFMWNTITVQYNPEIEEDWDEHFQVTCEYGYEFRRTVTFPVVGVEKNTASPYLVTLSPPQCYMEVRTGFGPNGQRLTGPVTVGDPLTLMIHMESDSTEFDVAVSSCYAHNGAKKKLQLIDGNGCILKEQLMSPFRGIRNNNAGHHVILYAYFKAFRFTSSPALYLECDVHMCHGTCPAQRCHWKSLTKRSVDSRSLVREDPSVSQNVSLFQALQVMQETADVPGAGGFKTDDLSNQMMCLPVTGVTAVTTSFMFIFLLVVVTCIFLCMRMRRIKEKLGLPGFHGYSNTQYYEKEPPRKRL